jgi:hypothetical protein
LGVTPHTGGLEAAAAIAAALDKPRLRAERRCTNLDPSHSNPVFNEVRFVSDWRPIDAELACECDPLGEGLEHHSWKQPMIDTLLDAYVEAGGHRSGYMELFHA